MRARQGQMDGPGADAKFPIFLSVLVPVYNELECLTPLLERLEAALDRGGHAWEAVVVDDGSEDGSGEELLRASATRPWLRVLRLDRNHGQSAALDAGLSAARGCIVALIDADLQTFPEDIPGLIEELEREDADAVVGIRVQRQDNAWKRFSSRVANSVRNRLTHEDVVDTGCPLKVLRREAVQRLPRFNGMHRFLPTLVRMQGGRVRQVPVRHAARHAGTSKYGTWDRVWRGFRDALGVRWLQARSIRWRLR